LLTYYTKDLINCKKARFQCFRKRKTDFELTNDTSFSKLYFSKVLYSFKAKYILVLIEQLNNTGFSTIFMNKKYIIYNVSGSWVIEVF